MGAMSPRTLRRLMIGETGLSFAQWRQQARLSYALAKLAEGETVLQIAEALGYASPSNFIAMFRKAFGDSRRVIFHIGGKGALIRPGMREEMLCDGFIYP